jgi:hypothetical protein
MKMKKLSCFLIPLMLLPAAFAASTRQDVGFVTKVYQDLLHRNPSPAEQVMIIAVLNAKNGGELVPAVITASTEFKSDEIRGYYSKFLGRDASNQDISAIIGVLFNGGSNDTLKGVILSSEEYFRHGETNANFLARLYLDVLNRPIDNNALATFEAALRNGASRSDVVRVVLASDEAHIAVIRSYYQRLLRRDPSQGELADFLPIFRAGGQDVILIGLLCNSNEYFNH